MSSLKSEFSGDVEDGMVAIVEVARNAPAYFAKTPPPIDEGGRDQRHNAYSVSSQHDLRYVINLPRCYI